MLRHVSPSHLAILLLALAFTHAPATASSTAGESESSPEYLHQLTRARAAYFKDIEGNRDADEAARQDFAVMERRWPQDPTVRAYSGSLDLLAAGRTWAVWNKRQLTDEGLGKLDQAVATAPQNLEVRFIRAATLWNLPFFLRRRKQAENDFTFVAPRAAAAARSGTLPPEIAAAALDYYGLILLDRKDAAGARQAFNSAIRVDRDSPAARDAERRLAGR